jgi:hypothetical protein
MSLVPAVLYLIFMPETLSNAESSAAASNGMNEIAEENEEGEPSAPYGRLA